MSHRRGRWPLAVVLAMTMVLGGAPSAGGAAESRDPDADPWLQVPADRVAAECGLDPALSSYHVASVTKTFGAVLFGMIAARSGLDDTDPAAEWIPAQAMGGIHRDATLAHVLAMTATKTSLATTRRAAGATTPSAGGRSTASSAS